MKKLLLFSLVAMITTCSFATSNVDSTIKTIIPDSAQVTFSKVYSDVKSGIAGIASALKVGSEHVYLILVKQQMVNSITWILIGVVPLLFFIVFAKSIWMWSVRTAKASQEFSYILFFIFSLVTLIPSIVLMFHIDTVITGFINPEYGAIKEIIKLIE